MSKMTTSVQNEKNETKDLKKTLQTRHMIMIGMGGSIGTALFLASGSAINEAGPGGAVLAYTIMGIMVYFLMTSLGEMVTYLPNSGSFNIYAARFYNPALGFAMGWIYWYSYAITVAFEVSAAAILMKFWLPNSPGALVSMICLLILFVLNMMSARVYGESEYWFATIKVFTVIIFLIVGTLVIFGVLGGQGPAGFSNWTKGEAPFVGGAAAVIGVFLVAGFCFQGTEVIGATSGESENPQIAVPKSIKSVFWRIMLFYIGAIIVISFLIPYNDPTLVGASESNVALSPFVIVFKRVGIAAATSIINAVILTSVLSCGNSCLYISTRTLYAMAKEGIGPKMFLKLNKRGVPVNAVYFTTAVGAFAFLSSFFGESTVYLWLLNCSSVAGFIAWAVMGACHIRFRKAYLAQGYNLNDLKYKSPFYPFGPYFALILSIIVIVGQMYFLIGENGMDWYGFLATYIGVAIFGGSYYYYKIKYKVKTIPIEEIDLITDARR